MRNQIDEILQKVDAGDMNPLDAMIDLKQMKDKCNVVLDIIKDFESEFVDDITFEAAQYPDGYKGYMFEVRNGRKMYNYSKIEQVVDAEKKVKDLKEYYKQAFVSRQKGILIATDDGEEIVLPELSISKSSIILKEKRK